MFLPVFLQMNFKSLPIPTLFPHLFVLKLFVAVYVRDVISNPDLFYQTCGSRFSCGSIFDIGYPFRGYDDPIYCGYPGLVLSCDENNITTIEIMDIKYRVLEIHQDAQTMRIAREDVMESICPDLVNTTLDNSLFDYANSYTNLTFLYGCPVSSSFPGRNLLSCGTSGNGGLYVLPGAQGPGNCNSSVIVPVLKTGAQNSVNSTSSLNQVMREGFDVRWKINSQDCSDCFASKGQCGYDFAANHTTCFCPNLPYTSVTCTIADGSSPVSRPSSGSKKNHKPLGVGLGIAGVAIAVVAVGWSIFVCRKRRKRVTTQAALSTEPVSKDIITTSSSKPLISSASTTFSKSIPSYTSPEPDLLQASSYFGVQIFNYTELEKATDYFSSDRELGDGGFGAVYHGILPDGREVAVKRLYENNFKRLEQFMTEIRILGELRHPNLVHLYGCTSKRSQGLLLVYEYIPNGTVADHLHGKLAKPGLLPWSVRLKIAVETADALAYLHRSDVIHRDVKTNNILLDNDFHVKVGDFGLSRLFPNDVTHVSTAPQGTPGYVDPEYYQVYQLTGKSDVYSFGVVLIELISSLQAVDTNRHRQDINLANMAVNKIQNHAVHELVDQGLGFETNSSVRRMASLVAELAFRCLQQERDMRPSMQEVLEALKGIENEELKARKEEVVEIVVDDAALIKGSDPSTPDSTDKSVRASAPHSV